MVSAVPQNISFPDEEVKILELWQELDAFHTSQALNKGKPAFTFYDGPPFATGLPHYGHIVAGTIKDTVTRYAHMTGHSVVRRFGWDCHGLPVEYEIDKTHNISGPEDVAKMGIKTYNDLCRGIVMRYSSEWERVVTRCGRWIDFKHDYKTMYPWFMESIWWVFSQLYSKGFVYRGFKVMPYSTACNTPLSNFEANLNYKDVIDPAVIVSFPLVKDPKVSLVAWTTTPWTLPSNVALCVNPNHTYVKVQNNSTTSVFIMMKNCLPALFKEESEYTILEEFLGKTLEGTKYVPLFDYFKSYEASGAFKVLCDGYVSDEAGVGVVHQAPYFGADDYRICLSYGIIKKDDTPICPVDASGKFTSEVPDFAGQYVKDADPNICKYLKSIGRLVNHSQVKHSYPFCWRSDTPLLYRAVPCWFIRVEPIVEKLLKNNSSTYWVPDHVKEGRFANWLEGAHDWAISRNRYWGTPMPLWTNSDFTEVRCISSIEELEKLSGRKITDLHREFVDDIELPSATPGGKPLKRVSEVFDCWFESGSMPYAQHHYPFEHKKEFEEGFPADFIAEGIDQTRGWFYTLLIVATALFDKPPFKNLIVNGLVLGPDGQKLSKRKKNYPPPDDIISSYGADALRLYLINSPVVRADDLRFREEGVKSVLKDVFLPWYNAYRFLIQNVERLRSEDKTEFQFSEELLTKSSNIMDKWILSFTQSLIQFVHDEMAAYRLYTVVPKLVKFIDILTNWYVRMNRRRVRGQDGVTECVLSLNTLFSALFDMVRFMAPFIPFLTEHMYQNLRKLLKDLQSLGPDTRSVHFMTIPRSQNDLIDNSIELAVSRMQNVIEMGRLVRERNTLPIKNPLYEIIVIHADPQCLEDVNTLGSYIKEELNVKKLVTSSDKEKYKVCYKALPNLKALGGKLKGDMKKVTEGIKKLSDQQLMRFKDTGKIEICGHSLSENELIVNVQFADSVKEEFSRYETLSTGDLMILLDVTPSQEMLDEGIAREVINRVQKLRKTGHLNPYDEITVYLEVDSNTKLSGVIASNFELISTSVKQEVIVGGPASSASIHCTETFSLQNSNLLVSIVKKESGISNGVGDVDFPSSKPAVSFVNVHYLCKSSQESFQATLLTENPMGITWTGREIVEHAKELFNIAFMHVSVFSDSSKQTSLNEDFDLSKIKNIYLTSEGSSSESTPLGNSGDLPLCHFVNVSHKGKLGSVLLENPKGYWVAPSRLVSYANSLFGLKAGASTSLYNDDQRKSVLDVKSLKDLSGKTVYI